MKTYTQTEMVDILFRAYTSWIAKWQLIMEQERESEETFDWFLWSITAKRTAMPINPTERRMLRSGKWFEAMKKEALDYHTLLKEVLA